MPPCHLYSTALGLPVPVGRQHASAHLLDTSLTISWPMASSAHCCPVTLQQVRAAHHSRSAYAPQQQRQPARRQTTCSGTHASTPLFACRCMRLAATDVLGRCSWYTFPGGAFRQPDTHKLCQHTPHIESGAVTWHISSISQLLISTLATVCCPVGQ
jgi:hypothetical protein